VIGSVKRVIAGVSAGVVLAGAGLFSGTGVAHAEPVYPLEPPAGCGGHTFTDVPTTHTHYTGICWVAANRITTNTGTYAPSDVVNRGSMATFMYRLAGTPPFQAPAKSPFSDVSTTYAHYVGITWLKQMGITTEVGTYSPTNAVNRGSMATFLYRLAGSPQYIPPAKSPYTDVATSNIHYKGIMWMKAKGLTTETGTYSPNNNVNRGSMATFMYRFNKAGFAWPGIVPPASSIVYLGYGWPKGSGNTTTISINPYSYNSVWQPPLDAAINHWNGQIARVGYAKASSSNTVTVGSYADTAYGWNQPYVKSSDSTSLTSFQITLNVTTIVRDATNLTNFIESVFTHELAHATWLGDNPGGSLSIMNYERNRNAMPWLQSADVTRINAKY